MSEEILGKGWFEVLKEEFNKPYYKKLEETVTKEYAEYIIRPSPNLIFNAFKSCDFKDTKVVMCAQDPYPSIHAHGLAFSSLHKTTPASLRTIFGEIRNSNVDGKSFASNDLTNWAKQGVLLTNAVLTVRDKDSNSHINIGWEEFTGAALRALATREEPLVFCLWGKASQNNFKAATHRVTINPAHLILEAGHPATAAYGRDTYSGNGHFDQIYAFLYLQGKEQIVWNTLL